MIDNKGTIEVTPGVNYINDWRDGNGRYVLDKIISNGKVIINKVRAITDFSEIKTISKEEAIEKGLFHVIGKEIDDKYIAELKKQVKNY